MQTAFQPGTHSYNVGRSASQVKPAPSALRWLKTLFLVAGLVCSGFYLYELTDQYVYQSYENWFFDQAIAGRSGLTFLDFVQAKLHLSSFVGTNAKGEHAGAPANPPASSTTQPAEGDLVARLSIKRLNIQSIVREGVSARTLRLAVGHVPSTALPGQRGNFAIAAHRDTLFRGLKDIRDGDKVTVQTPSQNYVYAVVATKIVSPSDVSVLGANGGGLYQLPTRDQPARLLTMITCYPFYYVGSAPKRFIVECRLISQGPI